MQIHIRFHIIGVTWALNGEKASDSEKLTTACNESLGETEILSLCFLRFCGNLRNWNALHLLAYTKQNLKTPFSY